MRKTYCCEFEVSGRVVGSSSIGRQITAVVLETGRGQDVVGRYSPREEINPEEEEVMTDVRGVTKLGASFTDIDELGETRKRDREKPAKHGKDTTVFDILRERLDGRVVNIVRIPEAATQMPGAQGVGKPQKAA